MQRPFEEGSEVEAGAMLQIDRAEPFSSAAIIRPSARQRRSGQRQRTAQLAVDSAVRLQPAVIARVSADLDGSRDRTGQMRHY